MSNLPNRPAAPPMPKWLCDLIEERPRNGDRRRGAGIISDKLFHVSHRSLEVWPVAVRFVNGRNQMGTRELLEEAWARLNAAPKVMQGPQKVMRSRRRTEPAGKAENSTPAT